MPDFLAALAYGIGAHGIMTLNDFKAMEGDRKMGINSLPVMLGADNAARLACLVMAAPQAGVVALLVIEGRLIHAAVVGALLAAQAVCMVRFLRDPVGRAVWYSAIGVGLYVSGMMVTAFALRPPL
jgi:chlorophyll synthase